MQMCGSTDRQVKSMQRNIFIHLYAKQIFSQMCDFHTSNEHLSCFASIHKWAVSWHPSYSTHNVYLSTILLFIVLHSQKSFIQVFFLVCTHVFCELSWRQARKWRQGQPTGLNQSKSQHLFCRRPRKKTKTNHWHLIYRQQVWGLRMCVRMTSCQI